MIHLLNGQALRQFLLNWNFEKKIVNLKSRSNLEKSGEDLTKNNNFSCLTLICLEQLIFFKIYKKWPTFLTSFDALLFDHIPLVEAKSTPSYSSDLHFLGIIM